MSAELERGLALLPEYMRDGARAYVERGMAGDFILAVASNNLRESYARADETNAEAMREWVRFFHNHVPGLAWGSPERVRAWMASGGLRGRELAIEATAIAALAGEEGGS